MTRDGMRTAVIGAGTMGTGIAQCLADHGLAVTLQDLDRDVLARSLERMSDNRRVLLEAGLLSAEMAEGSPRLIRTTTSLEEATTRIDLLFEAVPEDLSLKRDLYRRLDLLCDPHVSFASNTSGLSITQIASATNRPKHVAGFHWWNPAQLVPLVEIIQGEQTASTLIEQLLSLARPLGKRPVHVRRDVPGFVGNRLQFAVFREAMHLVEQGIVSPEDVDLAMTCGPGFRWAFLGPLWSADFGGLDVFHSICSYLWPELSNETSAPSVLNDRIESGQLGTKSGAGFYRYDKQELADWTERRDEFLVGLRKLIESLENKSDGP